MKNIDIKYTLFAIIIIGVLLPSCKDTKLSEEFAKREIIAKEGYPQPVYYEFRSKYLKDFHSEGRGATVNLDDEYQNMEKPLSIFRDKGLITIEEEVISDTSTVFLLGTTIRTWIYAVIRLTDAGKIYNISSSGKNFKVKIWSKDIGEITGIQVFKENNTGVVYYNEINMGRTPFGEIFTDFSNSRNKSAEFSLFEDGWRINK